MDQPWTCPSCERENDKSLATCHWCSAALPERPVLVFDVPPGAQHFRLDASEVRIGRSRDNELFLDDSGVSRLHAVLRADGGSYVLEDRDSRHGTFVNGKKCASHRLEVGDVIKIGTFRFRYAVARRGTIGVASSSTSLTAVTEPDHLRLLLDATQLMNSSLALEEVLAEVMDSVVQVTRAERGFLLMMDADEDEPRIRVSRSADHKAIPAAESNISWSAVNRALGSEAPVLLSDTLEAPLAERSQSVKTLGLRSVMCVPMKTLDRVIGLIYADSHKERKDFSETDLSLLESLASHAVLAVEKSRLYEELRKRNASIEKLKDQLEAENVYLQEEIKLDHDFGEIVGRDTTLTKVLGQIEQVAPTEATVLILGETGTGKELIARAVHDLSPRRQRPLVKVNCAALSASLVESELFGHEKGAFTGAVTQRLGRFEIAHRGTIFLDEVGELPKDLQAKLLRVLQEGELERVGDTRTRKVDVRVIAATNRDLASTVQEGNFREDLYYRLNVFPLFVPPLRDRVEDIEPLATHFVNKYSAKLRKPIRTIPRKALRALQAFSWPGNVRELEHVIHRAVISSPSDALVVDLSSVNASARASHGGGDELEDVERDHIARILQDARWRIDGPGGAAERLGLNRSTLRSRMKKLGISRTAP